jgi:dinuclear metal center YbgI/SA1388 family protein
MLVADLLTVVERLAPSALAEEWDNVGLIVGRRDRSVRRVLVALELRDGVLAEAADRECDAILVHHPPIFPALSSVTDASPAAELVLRAAETGTAVVAAHTNLDAAAGGLNDVMAGLLGLSGAAPLRPSPIDPEQGLGRVGRAADGMTVARLVEAVGEAFGGPARRFVGETGAPVTTVACCTGSGASLIPDAAAAGATAYVTSDLKYHDADRAAPGLALVSVPHACVERVAMGHWAQTLGAALAPAGVQVRFAETDTDPWRDA